jgi:hypothetical protein
MQEGGKKERTANAIKQARHKYALMTEVRQIRAELQDLPKRIIEQLREQDHKNDNPSPS